MAKVKEIAKYVRSKNAGPFWLTIDIFCEREEDYLKLKSASDLCAEKVAVLYHVSPSKMQVYHIPNILAIKYSFPRPHPQGCKYENDMHGGQQYVLLAEANV